ncbi:MAG: hypothetical protein JKY65_13315 [Planctomycetes bacterium]|nr:hypothetical protein [Planctomycetota bacterium]
MTKRVRDTGRKAKRIRDTGGRAKRVSSNQVAKALGAERVGKAEDRPVFSLAGLYRELGERLRSTGGRPALEGTTRRQKIPISEADWEELEHLSESLSEQGTRASPGQIASVLLHQMLTNLDPAEAEELLKKKA